VSHQMHDNTRNAAETKSNDEHENGGHFLPSPEDRSLAWRAMPSAKSFQPFGHLGLHAIPRHWLDAEAPAVLEVVFIRAIRVRGIESGRSIVRHRQSFPLAAASRKFVRYRTGCRSVWPSFTESKGRPTY
jgi:hypothetical protein